MIALAWLHGPSGARAVQTGERSRHGNQLSKMGNTNRKNAASRSSSAHAAPAEHPERPEAGVRLLAHTVSTRTALTCYLPAVRRFLVWAREGRVPFDTNEDIDIALCRHFDQLLDEELGPHRGDFILHGLAYVWPELSCHLPRAHRALKGWHRVYIHGEGGPQPMALWAVVIDQLRHVEKDAEVADALALGLDCYLRISEIFALRCEDVVVVSSPTGPIVSIMLGVVSEDRAETTKTGRRQGVIVDYPDVADMLVARKARRKPQDPVFDTTTHKYRAAIRKVATALGIDIGPPHSVRHSGPSEDAASGYRTIWAIQRRGRWASEKSVLRYAKTHALIEARSRIPEAILSRGQSLLEHRRPRPPTARE